MGHASINHSVISGVTSLLWAAYLAIQTEDGLPVYSNGRKYLESTPNVLPPW